MKLISVAILAVIELGLILPQDIYASTKLSRIHQQQLPWKQSRPLPLFFTTTNALSCSKHFDNPVAARSHHVATPEGPGSVTVEGSRRTKQKNLQSHSENKDDTKNTILDNGWGHKVNVKYSKRFFQHNLGICTPLRHSTSDTSAKFYGKSAARPRGQPILNRAADVEQPNVCLPWCANNR